MYASTSAEGVTGAITLYPRGEQSGNLVALRTTDGARDLRLGVYLDYQIIRGGSSDALFSVQQTQYAYLLLDREEREILVFHWHPKGVGPVVRPHLHVSGARRIPLPNRPTGIAPLPLDISNAHIPTGHTSLEDVLLMLIRDLHVESRDRAWKRILEGNEVELPYD